MDHYTRKPPQTFYLCWLLYDLSYRNFFFFFFFLVYVAELTVKPAEMQDSALTSDNLSRIFHNPNFISSYTRIIHVVLEHIGKFKRDNLTCFRCCERKLRLAEYALRLPYVIHD